jgi:putative transposase
MTRIARAVVPGLPHHVTQRGNRRERVFFEEGDYALYRDWLGESCRRFGVEVWSYCQMPNHVHLILTPEDGEGLALALSRAHRLYAGFVNARARQTGHLFQGRFGSAALDEEHLMNAVRYVALNPVRARLVQRAEDWPHSSVRAHLAGRDDGLVRVKPLKRPRAAFRRPHRGRSRRRRLRPPKTERADRPAARFGGLCGGDREASRARARAGQARPQAAKPGRRHGSIRIKTGVSAPLVKGLVEALRTSRARSCLRPVVRQGWRRWP